MPVDSTSAHLLMPTSAKQLLRDDDSLLRQMFFNVLRHHHPNTANKVDVIYALSQAWCTSKEDADFELLEKYLDGLKPDECILVGGREEGRGGVVVWCGVVRGCVACWRGRPGKQVCVAAGPGVQGLDGLKPDDCILVTEWGVQRN